MFLSKNRYLAIMKCCTSMYVITLSEIAFRNVVKFTLVLTTRIF